MKKISLLIQTTIMCSIFFTISAFSQETNLRIPIEKNTKSRTNEASLVLLQIKGDFFYEDLNDSWTDSSFYALLDRQIEDGFGYKEYWDTDKTVQYLYDTYATTDEKRDKYDNLIGEEEKTAQVIETKPLDVFKVVKSLWRPLRRLGFTGTKLKGNPKAINNACFICVPNMAEVQKGFIITNPRNNAPYVALCNPFQILKNHVTLALIEHKKQGMPTERAKFILNLVKKLDKFRFGFNSLSAGASIREHAHFHGADEALPIEHIAQEEIYKDSSFILSQLDKNIWPNAVYVAEGSEEKITEFIMHMINSLDKNFASEEEKAFNILFTRSDQGDLKAYFIPRRKETPGGFKGMFGFCEMCGLSLCERTKDYRNIKEESLRKALLECGRYPNDSALIEIIEDFVALQTESANSNNPTINVIPKNKADI